MIAVGARWTIELSELIDLLRRPEAYPHPVGEVRVIQTHISCVLLAGDCAYKLKKPVDFGFLDFRTLERRRHFCRREVELNSRLAPGLYQGVVPIARHGAGVRVEGPGEVVEWAVKMRRLPAGRMMDALAGSGQLPAEEVERLARRMARFHEEAPRGRKVARFGMPAEIARSWSENFAQTEAVAGLTHSWRERRLLAEYVRASLVRLRPLLLERVRANRIREGHGDLRTSAVCFDPACPDGMCIFDCIEFSRRFRCNDVASEIAFMAMDLELHGRPDLAAAFVDAYVAASGDEGVRRLLPFYGCYRAYVRGKVEGFRYGEPEVGAREQAEALLLARKAFRVACRYAGQDRPPLLLLMSGLSGTGKTTLARAIAAQRRIEVISSDLVRKELAGVEATERWAGEYDTGLYSPRNRRAVYEALHRRAAEALARGRSVILDATYAERAQRAGAAAVASEAGAYLFALECRAGEGAVRGRMGRREREGAASDARFETYLRQRASFEPLAELDPWSHLVIDTSAAVEASTTLALDLLDERLDPSGALEEEAQLPQPRPEA